VNAISIEFVFNDKGRFTVKNAYSSGMGHSKRAIPGMRGAQEVSPRFSTFLYLAYSGFVSEDEKPARAGVDGVLLCAIDHKVLCAAVLRNRFRVALSRV